jgi:hypothetical protein
MRRVHGALGFLFVGVLLAWAGPAEGEPGVIDPEVDLTAFFEQVRSDCARWVAANMSLTVGSTLDRDTTLDFGARALLCRAAESPDPLEYLATHCEVDSSTAPSRFWGYGSPCHAYGPALRAFRVKIWIEWEKLPGAAEVLALKEPEPDGTPAHPGPALFEIPCFAALSDKMALPKYRRDTRPLWATLRMDAFEELAACEGVTAIEVDGADLIVAD